MDKISFIINSELFLVIIDGTTMQRRRISVFTVSVFLDCWNKFKRCDYLGDGWVVGRPEVGLWNYLRMFYAQNVSVTRVIITCAILLFFLLSFAAVLYNTVNVILNAYIV